MGKGLHLAVGFVIALLLAVCGSSEDDALSKGEFKKQATLICHEGEQEREEAILAGTKRYQEAEGAAPDSLRNKIALSVLRTYEEMTAEIDDLAAPEGSEQEIDEIIESMEATSAKIRKDPSSAVENVEPFREPNKLWVAYGLNSCQA